MSDLEPFPKNFEREISPLYDFNQNKIKELEKGIKDLESRVEKLIRLLQDVSDLTLRDILNYLEENKRVSLSNPKASDFTLGEILKQMGENKNESA